MCAVSLCQDRNNTALLELVNLMDSDLVYELLTAGANAAATLKVSLELTGLHHQRRAMSSELSLFGFDAQRA